jgi:hypothetical protein
MQPVQKKNRIQQHLVTDVNRECRRYIIAILAAYPAHSNLLNFTYLTAAGHLDES